MSIYDTGGYKWTTIRKIWKQFPHRSHCTQSLEITIQNTKSLTSIELNIQWKTLLSNGKTSLAYKLRSTKAESKLRCADILASGKLFRLLSRTTGLWNPRRKRYALLCAFFVLLNVLSLLAEIIIPSLCGPFVDRCVTSSKKSVTNETSQSKVDPLVIKVYEITLAFDAWNAFSDTMTYALLLYGCDSTRALIG